MWVFLFHFKHISCLFLLPVWRHLICSIKQIIWLITSARKQFMAGVVGQIYHRKLVCWTFIFNQNGYREHFMHHTLSILSPNKVVVSVGELAFKLQSRCSLHSKIWKIHWKLIKNLHKQLIWVKKKIASCSSSTNVSICCFHLFLDFFLLCWQKEKTIWGHFVMPASKDRHIDPFADLMLDSGNLFLATKKKSISAHFHHFSIHYCTYLNATAVPRIIWCRWESICFLFFSYTFRRLCSLCRGILFCNCVLVL